MRTGRAPLGWLSMLLTACVASSTSAQQTPADAGDTEAGDTDAGDTDAAATRYAPPMAKPAPTVEKPAYYPIAESQITRARRRSESAFNVGIPIWFTPDDGVVDPGIAFEARFARQYGRLAPELTVGWQINWLDEDQLPIELRHYNMSIDSLYFDFGVRLYAMPDGKVKPFLSGAVDLSFWHLTGDTEVVCGYYYCSTVANYEIGFGFSGRAGLAVEAHEHLQVELGAKLAMTFPVGPIQDTEAWVTPFIGFASIL